MGGGTCRGQSHFSNISVYKIHDLELKAQHYPSACYVLLGFFTAYLCIVGTRMG